MYFTRKVNSAARQSDLSISIGTNSMSLDPMPTAAVIRIAWHLLPLDLCGGKCYRSYQIFALRPPGCKACTCPGSWANFDRFF